MADSRVGLSGSHRNSGGYVSRLYESLRKAFAFEKADTKGQVALFEKWWDWISNACDSGFSSDNETYLNNQWVAFKAQLSEPERASLASIHSNTKPLLSKASRVWMLKHVGLLYFQATLLDRVDTLAQEKEADQQVDELKSHAIIAAAEIRALGKELNRLKKDVASFCRGAGKSLFNKEQYERLDLRQKNFVKKYTEKLARVNHITSEIKKIQDPLELEEKQFHHFSQQVKNGMPAEDFPKKISNGISKQINLIDEKPTVASWESVSAVAQSQFQKIAKLDFLKIKSISERRAEVRSKHLKALGEADDALKQITFDGLDESEEKSEHNSSKEKNMSQLADVTKDLELAMKRYASAIKAVENNGSHLIEEKQERQKNSGAVMSAAFPSGDDFSREHKLESMEFKLPSPAKLRAIGDYSATSSALFFAGALFTFALASNPIGWGIGLCVAGLALAVTSGVSYVKANNREKKIALLKDKNQVEQKKLFDANEALKNEYNCSSTVRHLMMKLGIVPQINLEKKKVLECELPSNKSCNMKLFLDTKKNELYFAVSKSNRVIPFKDEETFRKILGA